MAGKYESCLDGHHCENGSICAENRNDEGGYYCDCDEANTENAVYAGLYCEHHATSYCTYTQEVSMLSFCTNGGTCQVFVSPDANHLGCQCSENYEGDHCQFVKGTKPDSWPTDSSQSAINQTNQNAPSSSGISGGIVALIVIIVLVVVGGMGFVIYRNRRGSKSASAHKHNIPSSELNLEADGSVLKESMEMSSHANGTGSTRGGEGDVIQSDEVMEDIKLSESNDYSGASEII